MSNAKLQNFANCSLTMNLTTNFLITYQYETTNLSHYKIHSSSRDCSKVQIFLKGHKIFQILVALSEYLNFMTKIMRATSEDQFERRKRLFTLRSQIEGYTRLLIFKKFSPLPAVIWASPFINFQDNFQPPCFFTYTNEKFSTLPAVIRASLLIKFEEKFQPPLLLEPPLVLET